MRIIRRKDQKKVLREQDNRQVRFLFSEHVGSFDWLMVTESIQAGQGKVSVGQHSHPNAKELIVFHSHAELEINGEIIDFAPGDLVLLEPQDTHGIEGLEWHLCSCILIGNGKPLKKDISPLA